MLLMAFLVYIFTGLVVVWMCYIKNLDALPWAVAAFIMANFSVVARVYIDLRVDRTVTITVVNRDGNQLQTRQHS